MEIESEKMPPATLQSSDDVESKDTKHVSEMQKMSGKGTKRSEPESDSEADGNTGRWTAEEHNRFVNGI